MAPNTYAWAAHPRLARGRPVHAPVAWSTTRLNTSRWPPWPRPGRSVGGRRRYMRTGKIVHLLVVVPTRRCMTLRAWARGGLPRAKRAGAARGAHAAGARGGE